MELGTDDEKALIKALEYSFPNSTRYLCTKHYMTNKETIPTKERVFHLGSADGHNCSLEFKKSY
jgi:hypothetical protein